RAQRAYDELLETEQEKLELLDLAKRADQALAEFTGTPAEASLRKLRDAYLRRIDERDIEAARSYSARSPQNFQTRKERYQVYLDKHPNGAFAKEATAALATIESEWDRRDFRAIRDHYQEKPGDFKQLVALCDRYLSVHPQGQYRSHTRDLLRWVEQVQSPGEYKVTVKSGAFDKKVARFFSRGAKLSVELEVNGVMYGPSNIVYN